MTQQNMERPADTRPLLRPGETCWRVEKASRFALLADGAEYFSAVKAVLLKAEKSILLLGWDFDPRTHLAPDSHDPLGQDTIGSLLVRLKQKHDLTIRLLIWDMALPLAAAHGFYPQRARKWFQGTGIDFVLDKAPSFGACHHQKVLVIDDRIAFCGSADFAPNRWDTPEHRDDIPYRRLPTGRPYPPRHEMVMMVDGDAASALGDLARERWRRSTGQQLQACPSANGISDPWPDFVKPSGRDIAVAIARTDPLRQTGASIRENERMYLEAIASARQLIYLENQYFASGRISKALAARLIEPDGPEIVVVCSGRSPGVWDSLTMDSTRDVMIAQLKQADRFGRFHAYAPYTSQGKIVIVHSKVAIFDDCLLRVGSTNLNNRSLGYDSECDLAIEAGSGEAGERTRRAISWLTGHLVAHYLGCSTESIVQTIREGGGLAAAIDRWDSKGQRRLRLLEARKPSLVGTLVARGHLGDPLDISDAWRPWRRCFAAHHPGPTTLKSTGSVPGSTQ